MERATGIAPSVFLSYQDKPRRSHRLRLRFSQINLRENISRLLSSCDAFFASQGSILDDSTSQSCHNRHVFQAFT